MVVVVIRICCPVVRPSRCSFVHAVSLVLAPVLARCLPLFFSLSRLLHLAYALSSFLRCLPFRSPSPPVCLDIRPDRFFSLVGVSGHAVKAAGGGRVINVLVYALA